MVFESKDVVCKPVNVLDFSDYEVAYTRMSIYELFRAYVVLKICGASLIVRNSGFLLKCSYGVLGKRITEWGLTSTFYGHFCGGEDGNEIQPVIKKLKSAGIGAILGFAAEADELSEPNDRYLNDMSRDLNGTISIDNSNADYFNANAQMLINSIRDEAKNNGNKGVTCINLTALSEPELLVSVSTIIKELHNAKDIETPIATDAILSKLDASQALQLEKLTQRLKCVASEAHICNVKLMIDAEQSYMQPAVDHLVLNLQRTYNCDTAIIFHTIQCYLTDSMSRLTTNLHLCRSEKWIFACKLVRGAYMDQERKRAAQMNYSDPVYQKIQETHDNYNAAIKKLLEANDVSETMIASHNQDSIQYATALMDSLGVSSKQGVYFAQLLGMRDNLSYILGANGYQVYKYVHYGTVKDVIPYLIRRAEENSILPANGLNEKDMIFNELSRRLFYY